MARSQRLRRRGTGCHHLRQLRRRILTPRRRLLRGARAALARLQPGPGQPPLLAIATGSYIGEGFDCPALDTLLLAAPISFNGRLVQYAGRILRPYPGKATAEIHDYHDTATSVLATSLANAPRTQPGIPRPPPHHPHTQFAHTPENH